MENENFDSKDIYLEKNGEIIGLHTYGHKSGVGTFMTFMQYEAWANLYEKKNDERTFVASIYRIFGPIEEEAEALKAEGWVVVEQSVLVNESP